MALTRGKLTNVISVSAASTVGIITSTNSKKVYIKSIIIHDANVAGTASTAHIYYVPNGSSVNSANRVFNVALSAKETVLIEPSYPITLENGDAIHIGSNTGGGTLNVIVNGDKEV